MQRLGEGLRAVGSAPAADLPALHRHRAGAVEALVYRHQPRVQRGGGGEHLEGGAGLVGVGQRAVAQPFGERRHVAAGRVVQVEVRLVHHGQDLAGGRVHGQHPHGLGVVHPQGLAGRLLAEALDGGVQGQRHAAAVHRRNVLALAVAQGAALAVDLAEHPARLAGEVAVQRLFQPRLAHAVDGGQADQLGGELAHGIVSLALLLQVQPVQAVVPAGGELRLHALELLGRLPGQLTPQGDAALGGVRGLLLDGRRLNVQHRGQQLREPRRVGHLPGADGGGVGRGALGEHRAVPVQYPSPGGLNGAFAGPLGLGPALQVLRGDHLEVEKPCAQRRKQPEKEGHT